MDTHKKTKGEFDDLSIFFLNSYQCKMFCLYVSNIFLQLHALPFLTTGDIFKLLFCTQKSFIVYQTNLRFYLVKIKPFFIFYFPPEYFLCPQKYTVKIIGHTVN